MLIGSVDYLQGATSNLVVKGGTCSGKEVSVLQSIPAVRVAKVVVANTEVERGTLIDFPGVFYKTTIGLGFIPVIAIGRLSGDGFIRKRALIEWPILHKIQNVVEVRTRLIVNCAEEHVAGVVRSVDTNTKAMISHNMREYIAPVIVGLDEVALGKADTESANATDGNRWDLEISCLTVLSLDAELSCACLAKHIRRNV